jgi:hypothetical protein
VGSTGFGFEFVFGYDPYSGLPIRLTENTPLDTWLATGVDPNYLAFFGQTIEDVDPELLNVPLREVKIIAAPDGHRRTLPPIQDVAPGGAGLAMPNEPITLGQWLEASGEALVVCYDDGTSDVSLRLEHMIPNGLFTVWFNFLIDSDGDGVEDRVGGGPMGGVPNVIVTDEVGRARFRRVLNFCPIEDEKFKILNVAYHSDADAFGAAADLPLGGLPGGTTVHASLQFPINVTPIE